MCSKSEQFAIFRIPLVWLVVSVVLVARSFKDRWVQLPAEVIRNVLAFSLGTKFSKGKILSDAVVDALELPGRIEESSCDVLRLRFEQLSICFTSSSEGPCGSNATALSGHGFHCKLGWKECVYLLTACRCGAGKMSVPWQSSRSGGVIVVASVAPNSERYSVCVVE